MTSTMSNVSPTPESQDQALDEEVPKIPTQVRPGRPRSTQTDEAYLRSMLTQARIDIAAGR